MKAHCPSSPREQALARTLALHPFTLWLLIALTLLLMSVPRLGAQDLLASARSLYESAAYDEALTTLQRLSTDRQTLPAGTIRAIEEYRFLCLVALGRMPEARESMAAAITADPMYKLDASATSPRILSAFQEVRRTLLPGLVGDLYADAKLAYDRKEFPAAESGFKSVLTLVDDPDLQGKQSDLATLAKGFLDLTTTALKAPAAPAPAAAAPTEQTVKSGAKHAGIAPPVIIRQVVPPIPPEIARLGATRTGILEVTIDAAGKVENAVFVQGIHPIYDAQILSSARTWRYQPATSDGVPIKFKKTIKVSMAGQE